MVNVVEKENIVLEEKQEFPLVNSWVEALRHPLAQRDRIKFLLDTDQDELVRRMGFPGDLVDVMRLWKEEGPDILTSYSHPEKPDLYKIVGTLNLGKFLGVFSQEGREFNKVLVNFYDTVEPKLSSKKPVKLGEIGTNLNFFGIDEFGFMGRNLTIGEINEYNSRAVPKAIEELIKQIGQPVIEPLVKKAVDQTPRTARKTLQKKLMRILEIRFQELTSCLPREEIPLSEMLMEFEKNFTALIFDNSGLALEDTMGIDSSLFSRNESYLSLVRKSLEIIMEKRGLDLFRKIINPGEGLAVVGKDRKMLTTSEFGYFQLSGLRITDDMARQIILKDGLPLGKLETIALIAGAFTIHMGSEYGIRNKMINSLGITSGSEAERYLLALRIGEDKEAGNVCITNVNGNPLPIVLGYVLLGKRGIREMLQRVSGKTKDPQVLDTKGLKQVFANQLIRDVEEIRNESI